MADKWTVTDQRQTTMLQGGRFVDVMEVSFRVNGTGITGAIDVPMYEYDPENIAPLLDERVAKILAVQNL